MKRKTSRFPHFAMHATGTLEVGETIVPVAIEVPSTLGEPAAMGRVYGPDEALWLALYHQQGELKTAGVKIPARFHSLADDFALFEAAPLFRALARHAAKRFISGV